PATPPASSRGRAAARRARTGCSSRSPPVASERRRTSPTGCSSSSPRSRAGSPGRCSRSMAATPSFDDEERYLRELSEFIAIPSVSSDEERRGDMRPAAEWVARQLSFMDGRVVEKYRHPVVLAVWLDATGCPKFLVFMHYDH